MENIFKQFIQDRESSKGFNEELIKEHVKMYKELTEDEKNKFLLYYIELSQL